MSGIDNGLGGGGSVNDIACSALIINTQIATPNPAYVESIRIGEELSVEVHSIYEQKIVVVMRGQDQRLGGLMGGAISRLRDCILAGTNYRATVTRANGPQVIVRIEPIQP